MQEFVCKNFYLAETTAGLIPIAIIIANCLCYCQKAEQRHKAVDEAIRNHRLTFDWTSTNKKAAALMKKVKNK